MPTEVLNAGYVLDDAEGQLSLTADRVTYTAADDNPAKMLYADKGAAHFDGDFTHEFVTILTSQTGDAQFIVWGLSNAVGSAQWLFNNRATEPALGLYRYKDGRFTLYEQPGDGNFYSTSWTGAALSTLYYAEVERAEDAGEFGTIYARTYSDADHLNELAELSLTLHVKTDFRFFAAFSGFAGTWSNTTGYNELYDLGAGAAALARAKVGRSLASASPLAGRGLVS